MQILIDSTMCGGSSVLNGVLAKRINSKRYLVKCIGNETIFI